MARQAKKFGLIDRVWLIKGGNLTQLIKGSNGVLIANSTVGLHSIAAGVPTIALGSALFDVPSLTHQSGLDGFWNNPEIPDKEFFKAYRRALSAIQVKGSFYNRAGQDAAVSEMVARLSVAKSMLQDSQEPLIIAAE